MAFCPNCGSQIREGAAFCAICGTKLSVAPEAAPVEAAPAPAAAPVEPAPAAIAEPVPAAEPVVEPAPVAEPAPIAAAVEPAPVAPTEPAPVAAPVEPAPVEAAPAPETPAAPAEVVAVAAPIAAAPAAPEAPVAAPVAEPVAAPVAPVAAPAEATPVAPAAPAAPAAEPAPIAFEAPSGPVLETPAEPAKAEPKKKGKGGIIALFVVIGVLALALIGAGVYLYMTGFDLNTFGIGGSIVERIERRDAVVEGRKFTIYDEDFNDYIIEARWWDYGDTMDKPGMYSTETEKLAFSIQVNKDAEAEIYYAYYYSKDKTFEKEDFEKPLYSEKIVPCEYSDGKIFYNVDCDKKIQKGYYIVIVSSDDTFKKPYIVAYAEVK